MKAVALTWKDGQLGASSLLRLVLRFEIVDPNLAQRIAFEAKR
jgi:hypothetical protein